MRSRNAAAASPLQQQVRGGGTNDDADTVGRGHRARDRDRNARDGPGSTQEPGILALHYPNSHYANGGWGLHTPPSWTEGLAAHLHRQRHGAGRLKWLRVQRGCSDIRPLCV
jgi:hypothetical protein